MNVLRRTDVFIAYEINYSLASKMFSLLFSRPYINKFQGTILKACGKNIKGCKFFYPANYFGINKSDLCIMVNDGTDGDCYCKERGLTNIFFEPHGVSEYKEVEIDTRKLENIDFNKFIIFNCASGARWKRVDRCIRFLQHIKKDVLNKLLVITTYAGQDLLDLKELARVLKVDSNIVFMTGLNQAECNYLIKNSKILLMTNDISNLGNPVLEAVYYNTPVISLNDGSLNYVFQGNDGGVLLDLNNDFDKKLANTIEQLVLDGDCYLAFKDCITRNQKIRSLKEQQNREFASIEKVFSH